MVHERAEKVARVARDIPKLEILRGPAKGGLLVVGWGGTYGHLLTAVEEVGEGVSYAHFDYIMPLPSNTEEVFSGFSKILVCELNSGQFAGYLRASLPQFNYLKCNKIQGQPFFVSELVEAIKKEL